MSGRALNARQAASDRLGFVLPQVGTWQRVYWDRVARAWFIRPGLPVTMSNGGEFWCAFPNGANASDTVYADPATGIALSGDSLGGEETPWAVVTSCAPGNTAIISTWSDFPHA